MLEKIEGIVIKTQDYGETHKIITIFSKKIGKFTALARGAKKTKSRMSAVTQPFIYGQFLTYISKGLSTLQQAEVLDSFRVIREDIIKTAYAAYVCELTNQLLESQIPDSYIHDQFVRTMQWINDHEEADIPIMMYELKLYQKAGFAPIIDQCVSCGKKGEAFSFSIAEGGILCTSCRGKDPEAIHLPQVLGKLLPVFLKVGLDRVGTISVKPENTRLLREVLDAYYDHYGGYHLKSRKFLNSLNLFQ